MQTRACRLRAQTSTPVTRSIATSTPEHDVSTRPVAPMAARVQWDHALHGAGDEPDQSGCEAEPARQADQRATHVRVHDQR